MMPNRYMPSALSDMVAEVHEGLLDRQGKGDDSDDDYIPEHEALVQMLQPKYREEYRRRRGELDG